MTEGDRAAAKQRAGKHAAATVSEGEVVGLGTGSTAAHAIRRLGARVDGGLDIRGVPTSYQSRALALEVGVPLTTLDEATPDVAIDGADQVAGGDLIKGGGAAHAREKVVDAAADRFLVVVDPSKESGVLDGPVPVEVLPAARRPIERRLEGLGADPQLRAADRKDGPVVTDNGNLVVDAGFGSLEEPHRVATAIEGIPGVVAHGLFVGMADEIHVGTAEGVRVRRP